jgi:hypothetical protein
MDFYFGLIVLQFLIFTVAALLGAACVLAVVAVTRRVRIRRRFALWTAFLFPVIAILYLEAGIVGRDFIRYGVGNDSFLNGVYHYPLIAGYQFVMFNENPSGGHVDGPGGFSESADAVQVAGSLILIDQGPPPPTHRALPDGGYIYDGDNPTPTVELGHEGNDLSDKFKQELVKDPPNYLVVDTTTSKLTRVTHEDLTKFAEQQGVALELVPAQQVLSIAESAASPSRAFLSVLFAPVLIVSVWLLWRLLHFIRGT